MYYAMMNKDNGMYIYEEKEYITYEYRKLKLIQTNKLEDVYFNSKDYIFTKDFNKKNYLEQKYNIKIEFIKFDMSFYELNSNNTNDGDSMSYLNRIIGEIECEINKYPERPNLGKRGCLRRLYELKNIMNKEKDNE
ncbi:MAG: hypothetical protein ACRCXT_11520 [Paraclostridium sp.]